jgi:TetR/AcrR family fatty acid metabolism transcriptional regulator
MPVATRQRRKGEIRRQQILDAAIEVFAERGFHTSRVSDIAGRAGVAYGLVYHYFDNKDEILRTIFLERWSVVLHVIESAISDAETPVEARLRSIIGFLVDIYKANADIVEVIVLELLHSPAFMRDEVVLGFQRAFAGISELVREGQRRGEIRQDLTPDVFSLFFFGGMEVAFNAVALKVFALREIPTEAFARSMVGFLMNGGAARPAPDVVVG